MEWKSCEMNDRREVGILLLRDRKMPGVRQSLRVIKQEGRRKSEEKAAGGTLGAKYFDRPKDAMEVEVTFLPLRQ